jgi:hypothetical protein
MSVKSPKVETRLLCSAIKGCELERQRASQPWQAGNYQLVVDGALEDLAANKIGQLFDMDLFEKVTEHIDTPRGATVPLSIR